MLRAEFSEGLGSERHERRTHDELAERLEGATAQRTRKSSQRLSGRVGRRSHSPAVRSGASLFAGPTY